MPSLAARLSEKPCSDRKRHRVGNNEAWQVARQIRLPLKLKPKTRSTMMREATEFEMSFLLGESKSIRLTMRNNHE